jgi:hypothetical protein
LPENDFHFPADAIDGFDFRDRRAITSGGDSGFSKRNPKAAQ